MLARVADVLFGTWQWCFLDWQRVFGQFRISVFIWGFTIFQFGFPPNYWGWQHGERMCVTGSWQSIRFHYFYSLVQPLSTNFFLLVAFPVLPARLWDWQQGTFFQVQLFFFGVVVVAWKLCVCGRSTWWQAKH